MAIDTATNTLVAGFAPRQQRRPAARQPHEEASHRLAFEEERVQLVHRAIVVRVTQAMRTAPPRCRAAFST